MQQCYVIIHCVTFLVKLLRDDSNNDRGGNYNYREKKEVSFKCEHLYL